MAKAETIERIPEYFHQWKKQKQFKDLNERLKTNTDWQNKRNQIVESIRNKTQRAYDGHGYAIGILTNLIDSREGHEDFPDQVKKFEKRYRGVYNLYEDFLEDAKESLELLLEARREKFRDIVKLEAELKVAEKEADASHKKWRELNDKYEKQWEKLLKEQQEADAKKQETKKEVA